MLHSIVLLSGTIVVFGLSTTCGAEATPAAPIRSLTEADAGRSIELRVADKLEVTLPGNPTTGFQWEVGSGDTSIIKPGGESEFKPSSEALGSGGKVTIRFEAVAAGQTTLKLIYHRPFEKDTPPDQTFEVTVTVK
jgi:inhibitor of cysteine peptidase